jgi:hypothetical protein
MRRTDHATPLYPQKLALTSLTSGGRSVGIVRPRTKATELFVIVLCCNSVYRTVFCSSDSVLKLRIKYCSHFHVRVIGLILCAQYYTGPERNLRS